MWNRHGALSWCKTARRPEGSSTRGMMWHVPHSPVDKHPLKNTTQRWQGKRIRLGLRSEHAASTGQAYATCADAGRVTLRLGASRAARRYYLFSESIIPTVFFTHITGGFRVSFGYYISVRFPVNSVIDLPSMQKDHGFHSRPFSRGSLRPTASMS